MKVAQKESEKPFYDDFTFSVFFNYIHCCDTPTPTGFSSLWSLVVFIGLRAISTQTRMNDNNGLDLIVITFLSGVKQKLTFLGLILVLLEIYKL